MENKLKILALSRDELEVLVKNTSSMSNLVKKITGTEYIGIKYFFKKILDKNSID